MVVDAEKTGRLKKGDVIVEATSGNTGIGLSLAAAVRGYQMIITLPEKMSNEKVDVLKGLGAKVIRTPTEAASESPESNIGVAKHIRDTQGAILLDQYSNPSNPLAHYDATAEEILYQCDGKVDAVVVSVGTGGVITGIARKIKEKSPKTLIVGIDPHGSILAMPQSLNEAQGTYKVEGIGYDFIPKVLSREHVDHWIKTSDVPSFKVARELIQKEGLLVGGSSGSTMWGAIEFAKKQGWGKDKRVVVLLADSVRNYITKFLSKEWCVENKMMPYDEMKEADHPFNGIPISNLNLEKIEAHEDLTVGEAKALFEKGQRIIPLKCGDKIVAVITPTKFMQLTILKKTTMTDSAKKLQTKDFVIIPSNLDCAILERYWLYNAEWLSDTRPSWWKHVKTTSSQTCRWPASRTCCRSTNDTRSDCVSV